MKSILIIEDNIAIRENATEMLELEGYNVYSAANGTIGLEMAKEKLPDIILSDVMMPGMNGHQVFDELKKDDATSSIPFVFMTSSVEKSEIDLALEKGADGFIKKPFEDKEFFETIKRCLSLRNGGTPKI